MSTIKANTYANGDGTKSVGADYVVEGTAKAWANLNGTGTIALRDSFNVSSVTDNSVGNYTHNFTNAMANGGYHASGSRGADVASALLEILTPLTSNLPISTKTGTTNTSTDAAIATTVVHGDLA